MHRFQIKWLMNANFIGGYDSIVVTWNPYFHDMPTEGIQDEIYTDRWIAIDKLIAYMT